MTGKREEKKGGYARKERQTRKWKVFDLHSLVFGVVDESPNSVNLEKEENLQRRKREKREKRTNIRS